jgi:hypothetical protein
LEIHWAGVGGFSPIRLQSLVPKIEVDSRLAEISDWHPEASESGVKANERLTALTGGLLFVLLALMGVTVLSVRRLLPAYQPATPTSNTGTISGLSSDSGFLPQCLWVRCSIREYNPVILSL